MAAALLNICVDPRLNHEALRQQFRQRIGEGLVPADRVFVVADAGGNFGSAARNTIALLKRQRDEVIGAALLHHDGCAAAAEGLRQALEASARALEAELRQAGFNVTVWRGAILTGTSSIEWADVPARSLEVLKFRMPRMYGK